VGRVLGGYGALGKNDELNPADPMASGDHDNAGRGKFYGGPFATAADRIGVLPIAANTSLSRNDSVGSGERTRLACSNRRLADYKKPPELSPNGESLNDLSDRRDAGRNTPEACAPQNQLNRSGLSVAIR
jgi:hypothetical protein